MAAETMNNSENQEAEFNITKKAEWAADYIDPAALDGLDAISTKSINSMHDINGAEKLNIKMGDKSNNSIEQSTTKSSRVQLETVIEASSDNSVPSALLEAWVSQMIPSKVMIDNNTKEATIILPTHPKPVFIYKGKEVSVKMKHKILVPESVKFAGLDN